MNSSRSELDEELEHEQEMLRIKRRNLRILQKQEANHGLDVPLSLKNQISDFQDQIVEHELRLDKLQTIAAESEMPLAEVEYRMHLAEAWDTPIGWPTIVELTRLDYIRLNLHIIPERAKVLELDIRKLLAQETLERNKSSIMSSGYYVLLSWLSGVSLEKLSPNFKKGYFNLDELFDLQELFLWRRLISLDPEIAIDTIIETMKLAFDDSVNIARFYRLFSEKNFIKADDKNRVEEILLSKIGPRDQLAILNDKILEVSQNLPKEAGNIPSEQKKMEEELPNE